MSDQPDGIVVERGVKVPMRDGILLDAMIWRPAAPGRYPVLIERVAYELEWRSRENGEFYARHGYVVIAQSVRGVFDSEGAFDPSRDDGWGDNQDGYDTIEWAAHQPWASGKVGMFGGSNSGATQAAVAPTRPPHLTALCIRQGTGDVHRDILFRGGALSHAGIRGFVVHSILVPQLGRRPGMLSEASTRLRVEQATEDFARSLWDLPLASWPPVEGLADWYWEILRHPDDGPHWWRWSVSRVYDQIDVPILHITSWYDSHQSGVLRMFGGVRAQGRSTRCREAQRLIVGPWMHGEPYLAQRQFGEIDFGPEAPIDLHGWRLRWYDYWLKGVETGILDGPSVRLFLMGTNRWLGCSAWPPTDVTYRPLYLASGDQPGQGSLTFEAPPADDPPDTFTYDPAEPVPSIVSSFEFRPIDCRSIEDQVLTYTSAPLEEDLHVVGPITAVLHAASSARDTDWVVRLCDVWPDGRSILVTDGILRARYRESFQRQVLMEPGQVYRFEVDPRATAQTFRAGHRLRVHVTSSDFPRFDRNLNTGGPFGEETEFQVATNTVFHDALRPSHLLLPIMSGEAVERALTPPPG